MPQITLPVTPQGLLLEIVIAASTPRQAALQANGQPIPALVQIKALVDTGADSTVIDQTVIAKLGIPPTGITMIHSATSGVQPVPCRTFDVLLGIPGHSPGTVIVVVGALAVVESDFSAHAAHYNALLGRDVLDRGVLIYNGTAGVFTLSF
jgi:hypothetical protein